MTHLIIQVVYLHFQHSCWKPCFSYWCQSQLQLLIIRRVSLCVLNKAGVFCRFVEIEQSDLDELLICLYVLKTPLYAHVDTSSDAYISNKNHH